MPWDGLETNRTHRKLTTKVGQVDIWESGDPSNPTAIILPLSNTNMEHQIPAFVYSGYRTVEVDFYTNVKVGAVRSEDILLKGGPAELVNAVMTALDLDGKQPLIAGYDHGASIGLRMAAQWPNKFSKLVAFHPGIAKPTEMKAEF